MSTGKILASYGADISAVDKNGQTPLHRAVDNGHTEFVEWLSEPELMAKNNISIDVLDNKLQTPLHLACAKGLCSIQIILVKSLLFKHRSVVLMAFDFRIRTDCQNFASQRSRCKSKRYQK